MKRTLLLVLLSVIIASVNAQTKQIKGKIFNSATGEPLAGVTVLADKKTGAATTDNNGAYNIKVNNKTTILVFSSVGFVAQTVNIAGRETIDVNLQPSAAALDDVVVIGYGTVKKSHLTGAVSKFKNENLDEAPVSRVDQALQGKIAGVQVQNLTSEAGAAPRVRVRGLSSINAGADPFVVVDGQPVENLGFVNAADVESIEVLKDAASAAIYGSRGANGVIIVTTKSGKSDKTRYSIKASQGFRNSYETQDMMTVTEYVNLLYGEAAQRALDPSVTANLVNRATAQEKAQYIIENTIFGGVPHDWQKEGLRTSAKVANIQANLSGGKSNFKYLFSGAYNKEEGLMYHSDYDKLSLRAKLETPLGRRVKLALNINPSYAKRERPSVNYIDFVRFPSFLPAVHTDSSAAFVSRNLQYANIRPGDWAQVGHFNGRVYSGVMPDGTTFTNTAAVDPFSSSNNTPKSVMETRTIFTNEYRVSTGADVTVSLIPGLDFKTTGSMYVTYSDGMDFAETNSNRQGDINRGIYTNRLYVDLLTENTLNYNKRIGNHNITGLLGFTAQKSSTKIARTEGTGFPSENIRTLNSATTIVAPSVDANGAQQGTYTLNEQFGILSYLGRVMYSFKDKYLLSASLRYDGTSYFAPGHRWANFPAASIGWAIDKENFMKDISWINQLKLRASYGASGNNRIPANSPYDLLYPSSYVFGSGTGTVVTGVLPSRERLANRIITWETTYQFNLGADISLFKNAISLTADVYQSKTNELLLLQAVMGFAGANQSWNNIGRVQNRGIEFELTTNNIKQKNFKWTTTANLASNSNKLLRLGGEAFQYNLGERNEVYRTALDERTIEFWGYKTDGVWLSQTEADAAKAKDQGTLLANYFTAGGLKLRDINGDGKINTDDRTAIGKPFPDFTWGITNKFNYKSFDLSFLFQGNQGVDVINGDAFYNESRKYNRKYNNGNRWVSALYPGDGKTPYFTNGVDWMLTDYVVEDGSYFALRELILGYTLPKKVAKLARITSLRLYATAQNLYYHFASGYRGINPEARMTGGAFYSTPLIDGYQRGSYPLPRTVSFGLDINF